MLQREEREESADVVQPGVDQRAEQTAVTARTGQYIFNFICNRYNLKY